MKAVKLGGKSDGQWGRDRKGRDGVDLIRTCYIGMHVLRQKAFTFSKRKIKLLSRKQLNRKQICIKYNVFSQNGLINPE